METISSRIAKILAGSCLIVVPLTVDSATLGYGVLLPLLAVPLVFSGMFDWRPLEFILAWCVRMLRLTPDDIKFTPKGAV